MTIDWEWRIISDADRSDRSLFQSIDSVFQDGFESTKAWGEDNIRRRLASSRVIGLLSAADGGIDGYALYSSPDEPFDGGFVLWEDSVCVRRSLQGTGRMFLLRDLLRMLEDLLGRKHAWLGG